MTTVDASQRAAKQPAISLLSKLRQALTSSVFVSIVAAFVVGAILIAATGQNPIAGYAAMVNGAFGTGLGLANTISRAVLIISFGIATAVAFRAGIFNLGVQGQAVAGALAGGLVALFMPGPGPLVFTVALVVAVLAGALWALIAAVLQNGMGVPILISSLLLNYPIQFFSSWYIRTQLQDPTTDIAGSKELRSDVLLNYFVPRDSALATTLREQFGSRSMLTMVLTSVNWSLLLVTLLVLFVVFLNSRTKYGFESGLAGQNAEFTRYGGVKPSMMVVKTMALSGGMAGFSGALLVLGLPNIRLLDGHVVSTGYAFTALLVTLLAVYKPLGTVISGIFFSAIIVGSTAMGNELGLSPQISAIIQALVIIFIAFKVALPQFKKTKKAQVKGAAA